MIIHCSGRVCRGLVQPRAGIPSYPEMKHRMSNIEELKSTGLKATLPRLKILEIFQSGEQRHMTAEDVYRVLTQFEQAGLLLRSSFESGKAVYELNEGQHHDHLVCLDCGRVEEFNDPEIENRQNAVAKAKGFTIADHSLSLYANCTKMPCEYRPEHPIRPIQIP